MLLRGSSLWYWFRTVFPRIRRSFAVVVFCLGAILPAFGQLTINGVADKTVYNDSVTFTVPTQAGFTYAVFLNSNPASTGAPVTVNQADFYQLEVTRTETATGNTTNRLIRFIVAASERADTEWGLPPQVPFPPISSSSNEFAGAHLRIMAPQSFPAGYEIPVVAWVENDGSHAIRANGMLAAAGHPSIQIKRGVGSGFLGATNPAGSLLYGPSVGGVQTNLTINIENSTAWTPVSGLLSGNVSWPDNSRIYVTTNLSVAAGTTLTIGAGTIVRINPRVDITNMGTVLINGTADRPVVFMPNSRSQPWGGFLMRTTTGEVTGTGVIFTGSGGTANWFGASGNPSSHRTEQALFFCNGGQRINLTDAAAMYLAGQLGHSVNATTTVNLTHFLMQRCTTGGEYTGANFTVNDSAFIECPDDSVNFVDGDNDGIYLVNGTHYFTNCLVGWTKDDGIDSGGSGYGPLTYQSCWFEATFHEGNSLSGYKNTLARDTVYFDCGQGIEDGYNAPTGKVDHCLFAACQIGVRHGDNYPSIGNYDGYMTVTNCIVLYSHHDLFGYNWHTGGGWTNSAQLIANNNFLSIADTNFPNNSLWAPATDGWRLGTLGGVGQVGVGLAVRAGQNSAASFPNGVPVGLSRFCTNEVRVDYTLDNSDGGHSTGTLVFPSGLTRRFIPLPNSFNGVLRVALVNPVHAEITGTGSLLFQNVASAATVLSPLGSQWRYLDDASDQGIQWRAPGFNDNSWSNGVARLGFGPDAAAATTIRRFLSGTSGPQVTNFYFRRAISVPSPTDFATLQFRYQRDDGCIVYLNGNPIITNNMPAGPVTYLTFASTTITPASETQKFWTNLWPASALQPGNNVIAAEVHQSTATSSDLAWELELQGLPAASPSRIAISRLGEDVVVFWSDLTFFLDRADNIGGPWTRVQNATSPWKLNPQPAPAFFRLHKP